MEGGNHHEPVSRSEAEEAGLLSRRLETRIKANIPEEKLANPATLLKTDEKGTHLDQDFEDRLYADVADSVLAESRDNFDLAQKALHASEKVYKHGSDSDMGKVMEHSLAALQDALRTQAYELVAYEGRRPEADAMDQKDIYDTASRVYAFKQASTEWHTVEHDQPTEASRLAQDIATQLIAAVGKEDLYTTPQGKYAAMDESSRDRVADIYHGIRQKYSGQEGVIDQAWTLAKQDLLRFGRTRHSTEARAIDHAIKSFTGLRNYNQDLDALIEVSDNPSIQASASEIKHQLSQEQQLATEREQEQAEKQRRALLIAADREQAEVARMLAEEFPALADDPAFEAAGRAPAPIPETNLLHAEDADLSQSQLIDMGTDGQYTTPILAKDRSAFGERYHQIAGETPDAQRGKRPIPSATPPERVIEHQMDLSEPMYQTKPDNIFGDQYMKVAGESREAPPLTRWEQVQLATKRFWGDMWDQRLEGIPTLDAPAAPIEQPTRKSRLRTLTAATLVRLL